MTTPSTKLRSVLDRLPFSVDDTEAANDAFRDWRERDDVQSGRLVDLWTYCYICRYFLTKAAQDKFHNASDADELITEAYQKVQGNRENVRDPDCYASWVSVICKNTFLNYTRRDRFSESINDEEGPELAVDEAPPVAEVGFVRQAFAQAINRLPNYLQEPAQLYFLEHKEFEEISEAVGKPVATVRTYKHKATKHLRNDDTLREYVNRTDL